MQDKELWYANDTYQTAQAAFQHAREHTEETVFKTWYDTARAQTALQHVYAAFKQTAKIQKLLKIDGLKILPP